MTLVHRNSRNTSRVAFGLSRWIVFILVFFFGEKEADFVQFLHKGTLSSQEYQSSQHAQLQTPSQRSCMPTYSPYLSVNVCPEKKSTSLKMPTQLFSATSCIQIIQLFSAPACACSFRKGSQSNEQAKTLRDLPYCCIWLHTPVTSHRL